MAIDLYKEHYDSNGNKMPLTVYPENDSPEIYPQREIYPQSKAATAPETEKLPAPKQEADIETPPKITLPETAEEKFKKKIAKSMYSGFVIMLLFIIAVMVSHNETEESSQNILEQSFAQNDVSCIDIDAPASINIVLRYSYSSSDISVGCVTDTYTHCTASNDNGTLGISFERKVFNDNGDNGTVTVTFPARYYGEVDVSTRGKGWVSAEAGENLHIETKEGSIEVSGLKSDEVQLVSESGDISVNNSVTDTLDIKTKSGNIYIADSETASSLTAHASDGSFTAKSMASYGETEIGAYYNFYEYEEGSGLVKCENITLGENANITAEDAMWLINAEYHNISLKSNGMIDIFPILPKEHYCIKKTGRGNLYLEDENPKGATVNYNPAGEYTMEIESNGMVNIKHPIK